MLITVPTSLSLGWIIGITVGVTVLILVVLFIILVLVCVTCRLCYIDDKSSKSQIGQFIIDISSDSVELMFNLQKTVIHPMWHTWNVYGKALAAVMVTKLMHIMIGSMQSNIYKSHNQV